MIAEARKVKIQAMILDKIGEIEWKFAGLTQGPMPKCRGVEFDDAMLDDLIHGHATSDQAFSAMFPFMGDYDIGASTEMKDEPCQEPIKFPKHPALPAEVHHTVKFNESAAWEAVVALSRGA